VRIVLGSYPQAFGMPMDFCMLHAGHSPQKVLGFKREETITIHCMNNQYFFEKLNSLLIVLLRARFFQT
jgi:hypothetical protein